MTKKKKEWMKFCKFHLGINFYRFLMQENLHLSWIPAESKKKKKKKLCLPKMEAFQEKQKLDLYA